MFSLPLSDVGASRSKEVDTMLLADLKRIGNLAINIDNNVFYVVSHGTGH